MKKDMLIAGTHTYATDDHTSALEYRRAIIEIVEKIESEKLLQFIFNLLEFVK